MELSRLGLGKERGDGISLPSSNVTFLPTPTPNQASTVRLATPLGVSKKSRGQELGSGEEDHTLALAGPGVHPKHTEPWMGLV